MTYATVCRECQLRQQDDFLKCLILLCLVLLTMGMVLGIFGERVLRAYADTTKNAGTTTSRDPTSPPASATVQVGWKREDAQEINTNMDQTTKDELLMQLLDTAGRIEENTRAIAREVRNIRAAEHGPTAAEERLLKRLIQEA